MPDIWTAIDAEKGLCTVEGVYFNIPENRIRVDGKYAIDPPAGYKAVVKGHVIEFVKTDED